MTAVGVSTENRPAFRITCDQPGCAMSETVRAQSVTRARIDLALGAPWACAHPPTYEADLCPRHAR